MLWHRHHIICIEFRLLLINRIKKCLRRFNMIIFCILHLDRLYSVCAIWPRKLFSVKRNDKTIWIPMSHVRSIRYRYGKIIRCFFSHNRSVSHIQSTFEMSSNGNNLSTQFIIHLMNNKMKYIPDNSYKMKGFVQEQKKISY